MMIELQDLTVYKKIQKERKADYVSFPDSLHSDIKGYLRTSGIYQLYSHQAEMFETVRRGEDTVITTSTASGKTLSFLLPVVQEILENPLARAIFIYPTKALASDQYRALLPWLKYLGERRINAGVYDGDTSPAQRSRIRKSANIILTNPEMLNEAFLPNHSKYGFDFIFTNLKYVVIDELHSYRGAFGSHLANIFRRLTRICQYYGSSPLFLCSSATIANPLELAENICGRRFSLISKDGAPAASREYRIIQPPVIKGKDEKEYGRYSAAAVAAELIPQLVEGQHHFIAFGKSRRNVEVILKESRDKLDNAGFLSQGGSRQIAGYRGGYTPAERKEIERKMISGELLGLVSTNALELGIDIGSLDTTVIVGYPGTRASFWQQTGRAGRGRTSCVNYLILENQPFDQYIAIEPDWLFCKESENAIVDRDNLLIQLTHIRSAAAEMPLKMDDIALFPALGEIIPVLLKAEEVKSIGGKFAWSGPAFPAGDYSLRNMDQTRFKLILLENGRKGAGGNSGIDGDTKEADYLKEGQEITEMDESQAYHEIYPGAVYMHEGALYEVLSLDLISRTARCQSFDGNYYTIPAGREDTRIIQVFHEEPYGRTHIRFGDINVNEMVSMFKKLQFHNHQNLGYVQLMQPLQKDYDTESTWLLIPDNIVRAYRGLLMKSQSGELVRNNHFEGIANAIKNAAMMVTMASRDDIDAVISGNALIPDESDESAVYLFIYDKYVGGLGYSEKIYDLVPKILDNAIRMVRSCPCEDGCPACVGDYTLDKKMVLWGLTNLLEETEVPADVKMVAEVQKPSVSKVFSFYELPETWEAFCDAVEKNGDAGGAFLRTVKNADVIGHRLVLSVGSTFYETWIMEPDNRKCIENILRYHAVCPADMKLEVTAQVNQEAAEKTKAKLRRRYEGAFQELE